MNTKDLLLKNLSSRGFIYYPEMKRLMSKKETAEISSVCVVEMSDDNKCRVYFSETDLLNDSEAKEDKYFAYDSGSILRYIESILSSDNTTIKLAA